MKITGRSVFIAAAAVLLTVFCTMPENLFSEEIFSFSGIDIQVFSPDLGEKVTFSYNNPNYMELTIRIFDLAGREVKGNVTVVSDGADGESAWDGTDSSGSPVKGGIYIYQVEAEGKIFNGTIVVAK